MAIRRRRGLANWADAADSDYLAREAVPAAQRAARRTDDSLFDATLQDGTIRDWAPDLLKGDPKASDAIRQEQGRNKATRAMRFFIRVTPGLASVLTGIAPVSDQSVIVLHNISEDTSFEALHNSGESSEGFRILFPSGLDYTVPPFGALELRYDATTKAYRPITATSITTDNVINVTNVDGDVLTTVINNIDVSITNIENELAALGWPGVLDIDRNTSDVATGGHNPNINTGDRLEFGNTLTHPTLGNITTDDDLLIYGLEALPSTADLHILSFNRGLNTVALGNTLNLGQLNLLADGNIFAEAETGTYDTISGTDTTNTVGNDWQVNLGNNATWTTAEGNILAWDVISETFTVGTLATNVVENLHLFSDNLSVLQSNLTALVRGDASTPTAVEMRATNGDVYSNAALATRIASALTLENYVEVTVDGGTPIDDWDIPGIENAEVVIVTATGDGFVDISGLAEHRLGKLVTFINMSEEVTLRFLHNDTGSVVTNRMLLPRANDVTVSAYESISFWRNDIEDKWNTWGEGGGAGPGAFPGGLTWAQTLANARISGALNPQISTGQRLELGGGTHPTLGNVTTDDDLLVYGLDAAGTTDVALLAYNRGVQLLNLGDPTSVNLLQVFSAGDASISAGSDILIDAAADLDLQAVDVLSTSATFGVVAGAINLGTTGTTTITLAAPEAAATIQIQAAGAGGEVNAQAETIILNAFTGILRADAGVVSATSIMGGDVVAGDFDWEDTLSRGRSTGLFNPLIAAGQYLEYEGPETVPTTGTHRYRGDASAASRTDADAQRSLWSYDATTDVLSWGATTGGPTAVTVASAGLLSLDALGNIVATAVGDITADAVNIDLDATGDITGDADGIVWTSTTFDVIAGAIGIGTAATSTLTLQALDTGGQVQLYADDVLDVQAGVASIVSLDHILLDAANHVRIQGGLRLENNTNATITTSQNNYAVGSFADITTVRVTTSGAGADVHITGIAGGVHGKRVTFYHVAGTDEETLIFDDESASSTDVNRIAMTGAAAVVTDESITFWYDGTSERWRPEGIFLEAGFSALTWGQTLLNGRASDGVDPLVSTGDYVEFEGALAVPASGDLRAAKNAFRIAARNNGDTADANLLTYSAATLLVGDSTDIDNLSLVASSLVSLIGGVTVNIATTTTTDVNIGNTGATVDVAGSAVSLQPTGNLVLKAFTGVLRADSGVVSVDTDVSDLVTKGWDDVLAVDAHTGVNNPIIDAGQYLGFDGGTLPGAGHIRLPAGVQWNIIGRSTTAATANVFRWDGTDDSILIGESTDIGTIQVACATTFLVSNPALVDIRGTNVAIRPSGIVNLGRTTGGTVISTDIRLDATGDVEVLNDTNFEVLSGGNAVINPTGNVQLKTFTGVLRADSGIVSVDTDVSDLVTKGWDDVLAVDRSTGLFNPLVANGQYIEFDTGTGFAAATSGVLRSDGDLLFGGRNSSGTSFTPFFYDSSADTLYLSGFGTLNLGANDTTVNVGLTLTTLVNISPSAAGADVTIDPADNVNIFGQDVLIGDSGTQSVTISPSLAGADVTIDPADDVNILGADVFVGDAGTTLVQLNNTGNFDVKSAGQILLGDATLTNNVAYNTAGAHRFATGRLCMQDTVANAQTGTVEAMTNPAGQVVLWNATAAMTLDGIAAPAAGDDGQCFWFINDDQEFSVTIRDNSASTAANGIIVNASKVLAYTDAAFFWYDNGASRWRCMVFRDN